MFLKGEATEALTLTAKYLFDTNPAVLTMNEAERDAWEKQLNRIFYST